MPDFHVLREQLHSDLSRVDWPAADDIRAAGTRRRRTQALVVAGVSAAVVLVITSVALLLPGGRPNSAPVGGATPSSNSQPVVGSPTPSPSPTASPSPPTSLSPTDSLSPTEGAWQPVMLPANLLLTAADVSPYFASVYGPGGQLFLPNPFIGCGPDGLVGPLPGGVVATGFKQGDVNSTQLGGESVLRYADAAQATQAMSDLRQILAGACATAYQVDPARLGGDESVFFFSTRGDIVVPQAAHGKALYQAVVRRGAYVVWLTIVDEYQIRDGKSVATTLGQRAATRLCSAAAC